MGLKARPTSSGHIQLERNLMQGSMAKDDSDGGVAYVIIKFSLMLPASIAAYSAPAKYNTRRSRRIDGSRTLRHCSEISGGLTSIGPYPTYLSGDVSIQFAPCTAFVPSLVCLIKFTIVILPAE